MKKIIAIVLIVVMLLSMVACAPSEEPYNYMLSKFEDMGFGFIKEFGNVGDYDFYLLYDYETGAEYILIQGYCEMNLTPYYGADGEVVIYNGR